MVPKLGRIGLAAVSRHGRPADVFVWMERTRAAALGHVEVPNAPEIGEELGQLRVVQTELTAAQSERLAHRRNAPEPSSVARGQDPPSRPGGTHG